MEKATIGACFVFCRVVVYVRAVAAVARRAVILPATLERIGNGGTRYFATALLFPATGDEPAEKGADDSRAPPRADYLTPAD